MSRLMIALFVSAGLAVAGSAAAQVPSAPMSKDSYTAAKNDADAQYKADKAACASLSGNAKDICVAQAKGKDSAAKADAAAAYENTPKAREKARVAPAGTGPFVARELSFGSSARFDRFDGYWGRAQVALEGLDLDLTEDSESGVFERFLDGQLDVVWDVPYPEAARLEADPEWRSYIDSSVQLHTSFLALRCNRAPLSDVRVRRALNLAVDRNRINDRFFSGLTVLASSILPPHLLGHDPGLRPYRCEPEKARALLAEAGHAGGVRLSAWQTPKEARGGRNLLLAIATDLGAAGIDLAVEVVTGEEMLARRKKGEHPDVTLTQWFADFADPDTFFNSLFYSRTDDVTELGWKNSELDRLVEKGARATDAHEREAIYRRLNRLVHQEAPVVFLFHSRGFVLHRPSVRGVRAFLLPPPVRWAELSFEG